MKFLTFVDLHEDKKYLKALVSRAKEEDIDFVVCAGDITLFGRGLRYVLKQFNDLGKKFYLIPGNHESDRMINEVVGDYENVVNFHKKLFKIENYVFMGYGGGGFALEDPEFRKVSREWYSKHQDDKTVLITHGPPYGMKMDHLKDYGHVGNKDYRKFIERIKPRLVICGHLHENINMQEAIGKTKIVHPGWEGMVIELN
jgi:uncharacterized protein